MSRSSKRVVVVGGGLAGLACARAVADHGLDVIVLEKDDRPGGRVATDEVDGFLIDRGFQVLLDSYQELPRHFDLDALGLHAFESGALVRRNGAFHLIADPLRAPLATPRMLLDRIVKVRDARAALKLIQHARSEHECSDRTTLTALREAGVSQSMMDAFWRPFLSGIMLDPELSTSSRFLDFVLANFASGRATVPGDGMRRLPELMLGSLPVGAVRTGIKVKSIDKRKVRIAGGGKLEADAIVVATDGRAAAKLVDGIAAPETVAVGQIAYDAGPRPPHDRPILVLDGDDSGPVNNLQVMSEVAPGYAPVGSSLVTCSILAKDLDDDDERLDHAVRSQLGRWYGPGVADWRRLKVDRIERALPAQPVGSLDPLERQLRLRSWLWVAGDHRATASIEGALASGRHAGEQVVAALAEEG